ncbi:MAG: hypothetical protein WC369_09235 [Dehalococcoidales bacterium]|jgi:hypothetical protein
MHSDDSKLVVIGTVDGELTAQVIKSRLESEGIPVLLQFESIIRAYPMSITGLAEVKILVPQESANEAKMIIGREPGFIPAKIII